MVDQAAARSSAAAPGSVSACGGPAPGPLPAALFGAAGAGRPRRLARPQPSPRFPARRTAIYLVIWTRPDYDDWKAVFDTGERVRKEYLCTGHEIYRDINDPNQLTVFLEFPSSGVPERFERATRGEDGRGRRESEPRAMFVNQTQQTDYRSRRQAA